MGYDGVSIGRDELARLVVTRAAADGATAEFFSHDILDDADGTRTLREESVEGVADALHANFVDAKPLRLRCEPHERHVVCTVISRRDNREVTLTLLLAPNIDVGWAVESWSAQ